MRGPAGEVWDGVGVRTAGAVHPWPGFALSCWDGLPILPQLWLLTWGDLGSGGIAALPSREWAWREGGRKPPTHKVASRSLYKCSLGQEAGSSRLPRCALLSHPHAHPAPPTKDAQWETQEAVLTKGWGSPGAAWSLSASHSSTPGAPRAAVPIRV